MYQSAHTPQLPFLHHNPSYPQPANMVVQVTPFPVQGYQPLQFMQQNSGLMNRGAPGGSNPVSLQNHQNVSTSTVKKPQITSVEESPTIAMLALPNTAYTEVSELDKLRLLKQRYKQILFGYHTQGYSNYRANNPPSTDPKVPDPERPTTPNIHEKNSKRIWEKKIAAWRRYLHRYDKADCPPGYNSHPEWKITQDKINHAIQFVASMKSKEPHPFPSQQEPPLKPAVDEITDDEMQKILAQIESCDEKKFAQLFTPLLSASSPKSPYSFFNPQVPNPMGRQTSRVFEMTPTPDT